MGSSMFVLRIDEVFLQPTPNQITKIPSAIAISVGKWCIFAEIGWTHLDTSGTCLVPSLVPIYGAEVGNVCGVLLIALNVFVSSNDHPVWASCLTGFVHVLFVCLLSQESMNHSLGSLREDGRLVVRV